MPMNIMIQCLDYLTYPDTSTNEMTGVWIIEEEVYYTSKEKSKYKNKLTEHQKSTETRNGLLIVKLK